MNLLPISGKLAILKIESLLALVVQWIEQDTPNV